MSECIFCKIISKEIPSERVYETDDFIVIKDIAPKAPIHLLIISKKHISSLAAAAETDRSLLGTMVLAAKSLAGRFELSQRGFKVIINSGAEGGQLVPHLHIHFLGGTTLHHPV
jgi:histidine triad (HIT) family protein